LTGNLISGTRLNLEVKRRPADIRRLDPTNELGFHSLFEEGLATRSGKLKFVKSKDSEVNVLGLTIYGPLDRPIQDAANSFIDTNALNVDAVAIWSWISEQTPHFALHSGVNPSKADRIREHLNVEDLEDTQEIHLIAHPDLRLQGLLADGPATLSG